MSVGERRKTEGTSYYNNSSFSQHTQRHAGKSTCIRDEVGRGKCTFTFYTFLFVNDFEEEPSSLI